MKKLKNIFHWDYKESPPFIEMLKFSRKHPELHLYEAYDHGGTFAVYIFALNSKIAKHQLSESIFEEFPMDFVKLNKCF